MNRIQQADQITWKFDSKPIIDLGMGYGSAIEVDPFPCYSHDITTVKETLEKVQMYISVPVDVFIAEYECIDRTLGFAQRFWDDYNSETHKYDTQNNVIVLHGKRTPIHPAVTRYLAAHEYGHHVQYFLESFFEMEEDELVNRYAVLRKLETPSYYGAKTWDISPIEVFANDFRRYVAQVESDYWPHPVPKIEKYAKLCRWWDQFKYKSKEDWKSL